MSHKLTSTQETILIHAHENHGGKVEWFPESLKGSAKTKTLESLTKAGLIVQGKQAIALTKAAYAALGIDQPSLPVNASREFKMRASSKKAQVIRLLKRAEGATIKQICEATGWQQHTVRGTFVNSFKKKLGLVITSVKKDNTERVYRIE